MAKEFYKEAFQYVMEELKKEYISKNNEDEFKIWFNMTYVEDSVDSITVSVASSFLQQTMQKKGNFDIVLKKLKEITGQDDINLKCIVIKEEAAPSKNSTSAAIETSDISEEKSTKRTF